MMAEEHVNYINSKSKSKNQHKNQHPQSGTENREPNTNHNHNRNGNSTSNNSHSNTDKNDNTNTNTNNNNNNNNNNNSNEHLLPGEQGLDGLGLTPAHAEALLFDAPAIRKASVELAAMQAMHVRNKEDRALLHDHERNGTKLVTDKTAKLEFTDTSEFEKLAMRVGNSRFIAKRAEMGMRRREMKVAQPFEAKQKERLEQAWTSDHNKNGWLDQRGKGRRKSLQQEEEQQQQQ